VCVKLVENGFFLEIKRTHLVCQDHGDAAFPLADEPLQPFQLVGAHLPSLDAGGLLAKVKQGFFGGGVVFCGKGNSEFVCFYI
jgi:hypothetical protein